MYKKHSLSRHGIIPSVTAALGRLQEDHQFEASLCHIVRPCFPAHPLPNTFFIKTQHIDMHIYGFYFKITVSLFIKYVLNFKFS